MNVSDLGSYKGLMVFVHMEDVEGYLPTRLGRLSYPALGRPPPADAPGPVE